jgi:hypothetical protein
MPASLTPASPVTVLQTSPATAHPVVPGALGWRQRPSVAPWALLQIPPQHWKSAAQTSPVCVQIEPSEHVPLLHSLEQHWLCAVHELPVVRQAPVSGTQVRPPPSPPEPQTPPQHCASVEHAWLSEVHCVPPQTPPVQTNVQQSCGMVQALPPTLHMPFGTQIFIWVSHIWVQQSALPTQVAPASEQVIPPPAPPVAAPPVFVPPAPAVTLPSGLDPALPPPEPVLPVGAAASSPPHRTSMMPGNIARAAKRILFIIIVEPPGCGS